MTANTETERADFEAWLIQELDAVDWSIAEVKDWYFTQSPDGGYVQQQPNDRWKAWQAARRAPVMPRGQAKPFAVINKESDSMIDWLWKAPDLIRKHHGQGLYLLAAAPQPPEQIQPSVCKTEIQTTGCTCNPCMQPSPDHIPAVSKMVAAGESDIGIPTSKQDQALAAAEVDMGFPITQQDQQVAAPVQLPEPQAEIEVRSMKTYLDLSIHEWRDKLPDGTYKVYTEQQVLQHSAALKFQLDELAMLTRMVVHAFRQVAPDNKTAAKAVDYLKRQGLAGNPFRAVKDQAHGQQT